MQKHAKNLLTFSIETDIIDKEFGGLFKFALDESAYQAFSTAIIHNGNISLHIWRHSSVG